MAIRNLVVHGVGFDGPQWIITHGLGDLEDGGGSPPPSNPHHYTRRYHLGIHFALIVLTVFTFSIRSA